MTGEQPVPLARSEECGRVITFRLGKPTPLLNRTMDQHWSKRLRRNRATAWEVKVALGALRLAEPLQRARVTIERRSISVPDYDGMVGGLKSVIDSLLPVSRLHPCGLGLVVDDGPQHMLLVALSVRVKTSAEQGTWVTIEELSAEAPEA
jgi:hypothetical protein